MYPIFDLHCDTILECEERGLSLHRNPLQIDLCKLEAAGAYCQCFAIFVNQEACRKRGVGAYERYMQVLSCYRREMKENSSLIAPAFSAADIHENYAAQRISSILTVEGGEVLEGRLDRLDTLYQDGVRLLTLTWNYENEIAFPNGETGGLKPFGFQVVERMNELGMAVDVSHLSDSGFYDVIAHSKRPVAATHSCARALCSHKRNLTDDMMRELGRRGGIVGLNFYSRFLKENSDFSTMEQVLSHAKHIVSCAGIDALALGSDYDGMDCGLEWKDYAGMPKLLSRLSEYFSVHEMEKICYRNAERFFGEHGF